MDNISRKKEFERLNNILDKLLNIIAKSKIEMKLDMINYTNKELADHLTNDNLVLKLFTELENKINKEKESIKELKDPLLLFIVGSGNYGKSTLINALMKEKFIKTTALPNTWKLDLFTKSDKEEIKITYSNDSIKEMTLKEGLRLLQEEEAKFNKSKKKILTKIQDYKSYNNPSIEELKNYKKQLEDNELYISNIIQTKYYLDKKGILEDFIIADTPGINQNLSKSMLSSIEDYYIKSDGILWLIDGQNIVSKSTTELISDMDKLNNKSEFKKKMVLVVNKIDIIESTNKDNIQKVKEKVIEIYKEKFDDIVFISAKNAIEGYSLNNQHLIKESNINSLFTSITKNFKENSEINQINSKRKNISLMAQNIEILIENYKRKLYKDISIYNTSSFDIKDKVKSSNMYIRNLVCEMKNKRCYKELDVYHIQKDIKDIESIGNSEIKKIYDYANTKFYSTNNLNNDFNKNKLSISKNKNIVIDYNILKKSSQFNSELLHKEKNLFNMRSKVNQSNKIDEYTIKNEIYTKINILFKESIREIDDKFENILYILEKYKEDNFKNKYTDYIIIKEHIKQIEKINTIIVNLR